MYTTTKTLTKFVLYLFLFFFTDVDARSLAFKNGELLQSKDKETFPLKYNFMTTSQHNKQDLVHFGATTISSSRIKAFLNAFKRPLYSRETNDLNSTSERKCKRNPTKRRRRRFVLQGSKMRKTDITWGIAVFSKKLTRIQQITILETAFRTWSSHCVLSFTYNKDLSKANIVITFSKGNHGDKMPFDDGGDIKAHAFFPTAGSDIHFDEYESWVDDPNGRGGISLLTVAIHEIGHSLGLKHSSARNTVMAPILSKGKNSLFDDDIKGIQALYGKCLVQKLDAVVTSTANNNFKNKALVFKNEWVWDVDIMTGKIIPGYPRKIGKLFNSGLYNKHPFKVVFYEHSYNTYVFMNDNGYSLVEDFTGFPVRHQYTYDDKYSFFPFLEDVGVPDAAFVDPDSHNIYHFFKGKQYYKFDMGKYQLMPGYPKAINTVWPNVPNDLDVSYYSYDEKAYYFIKSNQYYKLVKKNKKLVFHSIGILNDIFKNICPI